MSAYLITSESGTGKTTVIDELSRRGYHAYGNYDILDRIGKKAAA